MEENKMETKENMNRNKFMDTLRVFIEAEGGQLTMMEIVGALEGVKFQLMNGVLERAFTEVTQDG